MPNVFVDGGAHKGESVRMFREEFPGADEFEIYCFEPNPAVQDDLKKLEDVTIIQKAIWITDGARPFYVGSHTHTGSLRSDKTTFPVVDKIYVECIDFPEWLAGLAADRLIVKFDLEGAEYTVLSMMNDDLIQRIEAFYIDFHGVKLADFDMEMHRLTVERLKTLDRPHRMWRPNKWLFDH